MTKYEINVAYEGSHNFTVVVDRNGPEDTNIGTARFVKRSLKESLGIGYTVHMTCIKTTTTTTTY